jgi:hypothetical protein
MILFVEKRGPGAAAPWKKNSGSGFGSPGTKAGSGGEPSFQKMGFFPDLPQKEPR